MRLLKIISLLRVLKEQLYQRALSTEEATVIASNLTKSLSDICKTLVPYSDVDIRTGVAIHKTNEIFSYTASKG